MLRTRLWMGALLIALAVGVLLVDPLADPWAPFLLALMLALSLLACRELLSLFRHLAQPVPGLCYGAVAWLIVANWVPHVTGRGEAWPMVCGAFAAVVLLTLLAEMAIFEGPGESVQRIGL